MNFTHIDKDGIMHEMIHLFAILLVSLLQLKNELDKIKYRNNISKLEIQVFNMQTKLEMLELRNMGTFAYKGIH